MRIKIKPLSVNEAYSGKRYKTEKYKRYKFALLCKLPRLELPPPPYRVEYVFGLSNPSADIDNPVKPFQDVLQAKYGFNDKHIDEISVKRAKVPKGSEFISFKIEAINTPPNPGK